MKNQFPSRLAQVPKWVIMGAVLCTVITAVFGFGIFQVTHATHAAGTVHGCPLGYACIYPQDAGWNNDHPSKEFYYFGTYQLSNQYGTHYVFNNQVGGASFWLCTDWHGNTCMQFVPIGEGRAVDLTPINSVKLSSTPDPTWQA
ncbi:MAG: hypothetical protein J2P36_11595 [Ktedonobacteraceae bacterium]|nr:hypothetical protein [Ktedonobacteraceae bacterium]